MRKSETWRNDRDASKTWPVLLSTLTLVLIFGVAFWAVVQADDPDPLIVGNSAAFGGGTIRTYNVPPGTLAGSFVPTGAFDSNNGRGVAVLNNEVFYTELSNSFGPTDFVRVAPFNGGAGGADTRTLPNPRPGAGVQDLVFSHAVLYALTGYGIVPSGTPQPLRVFGLSPVTGAVVSGPVNIAAPATPVSDGFTVLPNGHFLINNGDASCTYNEYNATTGALIPLTTLVVPGGTSCTGVDTDGFSLYFRANVNIIKTTLTGTLISTTSIGSNSLEDIEVAHTARFMTGGGGVTTSEVKVTHGFELYCDETQAPSNNLEVNWSKGNHFHLTNVTSASCGGAATNSPPAGFSIFSGTGTGLCNGLAATASFTFVDVAEPGIGADTATINISGGCTLASGGLLTQGNNQAHGQ